jgi:hypothetical protein
MRRDPEWQELQLPPAATKRSLNKGAPRGRFTLESSRVPT